MPHPNGPRQLRSFIFFLLKTDFFVPISVPLHPHAHISQTNYTQPFESSAAGCWRRLGAIRQRGHSILCSPNWGAVTRKPKPRADKQALGHVQPQTEAKGGRAQIASSPRQPSWLLALHTETSGSPRRNLQGKDSEETPLWARPPGHQALLLPCRGHRNRIRG